MLRLILLALSICLAPCARAQVGPQSVSADEWVRIRAAHEAAQLAIVAKSDGYQARNPRQQWTTHFDGFGFRIEPDHAEWNWGLELASYGRSNAVQQPNAQADIRTEGDGLSYRWDATLEEWWKNESRGLEHGYTLYRRPDGEGPLSIHLRIRGGLRPILQNHGLDVAFYTASQAVLHYVGLHAFDAEGKTVEACFALWDEGLCLIVHDDSARYPITIDPVAQQAYLKASNTEPSDLFGRAVAISGDTLVIGAPGEDSAANGANGNQADNSHPSAGAVYIFVRSGPHWTQQAYLKASNTGAGDSFGYSVAIDGNTVVVGAPSEDSSATGIDGNQFDDSMSSAGAAYVFVRAGSTWQQQAYLKASNPDAGDSFGWAVAVSGDTVCVGAVSEDSSSVGVNGLQQDNGASGAGAAYVFHRTGTSWSQQAYIKASNAGPADWFGSCVTLCDDILVVGSYLEDSAATGVNGDGTNNAASNSGAVYVFQRNASTWTQQAYLKPLNTDADDGFGYSVCTSGSTIVIGAPGEASNAAGVNGNSADNSIPYAGAVYVFDWIGSTWAQSAYIKPSNPDADDSFGWSTAVMDDILIATSSGEASAASGTNGSQTSNSSPSSGAAYVFERSGFLWLQRSYLKAANSQAFDYFGWSTALSGTTMVVGAFQEDSSATGVNGNATDNSADNSGAAYVFELRSGCLGANGRPHLSAAQPPQLGQSYTLTVDNLEPVNNFAVLVFGALHLPLPGVDLGPILGMTGCDLYHSPDIFVPAPLGTSGSASWTWSPVTGLPGDDLFSQALCLDLAANPFGFTVSNQLRITLVP